MHTEIDIENAMEKAGFSGLIFVGNRKRIYFIIEKGRVQINEFFECGDGVFKCVEIKKADNNERVCFEFAELPKEEKKLGYPKHQRIVWD